MSKKLTPENCPFIPFNDMLIVKKLRHDMTAGGIALPDDARKKDRFAISGIVIAVGPAIKEEFSEYPIIPLNSGDIIVFSSQAGLEMGDILRLVAKDYDIAAEDSDRIVMLKRGDIVCKVKK